MKKYLFILIPLYIVIASCGGNTELNKHEEKAVQTQVEKDQQAMDSLEKAIQAQINQADSVK